MEVMKANIAYKFELMPTREQTRIFAQAAGCRRFVWNKATELQKQRLEHNLPFLNYAELCEKLTCWKQEDDMLWLQDAPSQGECQDFCVWGGYSRGSPTRLPFVFEMQYARPDAIAGAKVEGPARSAGGSSLAPAIARREAAGALAREV